MTIKLMPHLLTPMKGKAKTRQKFQLYIKLLSMFHTVLWFRFSDIVKKKKFLSRLTLFLLTTYFIITVISYSIVIYKRLQ